MLDKLAADPANGIDRILTGTEAEGKGAFPGAAFLVLMRVGFYTGAAFTGPLLRSTAGHGTHGYSPDASEMRSSFFAMGPGIAHGRDLGEIDMRTIAPSVATMLGIDLPSAGGKPLPLAGSNGSARKSALQPEGAFTHALARGSDPANPGRIE